MSRTPQKVMVLLSKKVIVSSFSLLSTLPAMQNQIAAYLPSPSPVVTIVYHKDPYQYVAVFVNQTRQQAEDRFKQSYPLEGEETYQVNEYENVESYSVTEDGTLVVNGSYK
jgi:hypothetical protein